VPEKQAIDALILCFVKRMAGVVEMRGYVENVFYYELKSRINASL
jgi:hypothetical protein